MIPCPYWSDGAHCYETRHMVTRDVKLCACGATVARGPISRATPASDVGEVRCSFELGGRCEVRTFRVRDSRVHASAPGVHGTETWTVYYYPTENNHHAKLDHSPRNLDEAVVKACQLADIFDPKPAPPDPAVPPETPGEATGPRWPPSKGDRVQVLPQGSHPGKIDTFTGERGHNEEMPWNDGWKLTRGKIYLSDVVRGDVVLLGPELPPETQRAREALARPSTKPSF